MPPLKSTSKPAAPRVQEESPYDRSRRLLEEQRTKLFIDKDDLDTAWLEHSSHLDTTGSEYALAISYRDEAETELGIEQASVDRDIRAAHAKKGEKTDKLMESAVKAQISLNPLVQTLDSTFRDWKLLASEWGALVKSFDARLYALRNLSSLWEKSYWTSNSHKVVPRTVGDSIANEVRRSGN